MYQFDLDETPEAFTNFSPGFEERTLGLTINNPNQP